jgi:hypothetical protein
MCRGGCGHVAPGRLSQRNRADVLGHLSRSLISDSRVWKSVEFFRLASSTAGRKDAGTANAIAGRCAVAEARNLAGAYGGIFLALSSGSWNSAFSKVPIYRISLDFFPKSEASSAPSRSFMRGASADRHETWGGMRWTRRCWRALCVPIDRHSRRTAKSCGPGAPGLALSLAGDSSEATVTMRSRTPGRARSSVNTIAQGRPACSGEPVVTNSRVFYLAREAAGASASGLPCALMIFEGARMMHHSGESCRGNAGVCLQGCLK